MALSDFDARAAGPAAGSGHPQAPEIASVFSNRTFTERSVTGGTPRDAAREASRETILNAALSRLASRGYDGTSIRQIAERAGVSHGLLYSHFERKEDLLRGLMRLPLEDVGGSLAAGSGNGPAAERLERLAMEGARLVRQHLEVWRLSYAIRMQPAVLEAMAPLYAK